MKNNIVYQRFIVISTVVMMTGCGAAEVLKKTDDTYSVTSQYGSINGSWDRAARESFDKAQVYCEGRRQKMMLVEERRDGIFGISPQRVDITFRCVDETNTKNDSNATTEDRLSRAKALYEISLLTETQYNEQVRSILSGK